MDILNSAANWFTLYCNDLFQLLFRANPIPSVIEFLYIYAAGTILFDIIHYGFHQCEKSNYSLLRKFSQIHMVHHRYFNRRLEFNHKYQWHNTWIELPLELVCQAAGTYFSHKLVRSYFNLGDKILILCLGFEVVRTGVVMVMEGKDSNHIPYDYIVPKDTNLVFVGPEYHALHHVTPERFISSFCRLFDWVCGTGYVLRKRRVTIIGERDSLLMQELEKMLVLEEVKSLDFIDSKSISSESKTMPEVQDLLQNTDVFIVSSTKHKTSMESYTTIVEELVSTFQAVRKPHSSMDKAVPEIWRIQTSAGGKVDNGDKFKPTSKQAADPNMRYRSITLRETQDKTFVQSSINSMMFFVRRGYTVIDTSSPFMLGLFSS